MKNGDRVRREKLIARNKAMSRGIGSRGGMSEEELRVLRVDATREIRHRKADRVAQYRNERGCQACGEKHPATLDLHHRNGEEKHEMLRVVSGKRKGTRTWRDLSFAAIEAELPKCDVLCANCHRILHWEEKEAQQKEMIV